jgi:hypothetical protein
LEVGLFASARPKSPFLAATAAKPKGLPWRYAEKRSDDEVEDKRLQELLKQKALIEGHLQWIESEIAALQPSASSFKSTHVASNWLESLETQTPAVRVAPTNPSPKPSDEPDPKAAIPDIYDELGPDTRDSVNDARRGCIMIFAGAFLALGLLSLWVWYKY